jgi:ATP-dependent DNA helicase RecG
LIKENPKVTTQEMADTLGIIRRTVTKHIKNLREQGVIKRVGPDKGGHWEVIEE